MNLNDEIAKADLPALKVIHYPDPRLSRESVDVPEVDDAVRALVSRMFEIMFTTHGVGLAAPQVGINARIFVASPTFQETDRRVYINPKLVQLEGSHEVEEGCLSLPGITGTIKRYDFAVVQALNENGQLFEETGEELLARIYQHEIDHLDGKLLINRMGSVAQLASRRALKQLEDEFTK